MIQVGNLEWGIWDLYLPGATPARGTEARMRPFSDAGDGGFELWFTAREMAYLIDSTVKWRYRWGDTARSRGPIVEPCAYDYNVPCE